MSRKFILSGGEIGELWARLTGGPPPPHPFQNPGEYEVLGHEFS